MFMDFPGFSPPCQQQQAAEPAEPPEVPSGEVPN